MATHLQRAGLCVPESQHTIAYPPAKPGLAEFKCAYLPKDTCNCLPPTVPITNQPTLPLLRSLVDAAPLSCSTYPQLTSGWPQSSPEFTFNFGEASRRYPKANSPVSSLVLTTAHNSSWFCLLPNTCPHLSGKLGELLPC